MGKKFLIVDDEPAVLKVCEKALSVLPLEIETAMDEAGSIKLLKEKAFDGVLVDLKLKERNGLKIIEYAQKLYPKICTTLMTGTLKSDELEKKIKKIRIGAIIYKPFTVHQLRDVVKDCLGI